ncbi:hypothetical protein LC653_26315 [Nostoc sp. CHAB 5784]|nr:hypothetical protein [Nostoc mirabile CHAB5784]
MSKEIEFFYVSVVIKTIFNNRYLVFIDERSLSHEICTCDFGFEDNIEPLDNSSLERLK